MKPFIFLLLCYGISLPYAMAQQWSFEALGAERGLPASETYNMVLDDKGYVCIATEYGLVKYNGNRFIPICSNIPVRERIAYAFCKDNQGAYCFANSQFHFYTIRNDRAYPLPVKGRSIPLFPDNSYITRFFIDSADNVYASTPYKDFLCTAAKNKWALFKEEHEPSDTSVITRVSDNFFSSSYVRNKGHIVIRNTPYAGYYQVPHPLPGLVRYRVEETSQGIYLVWQKQLLQITKQKKLQVYTAPSNVISINFSPDGHIWLGLLHRGVIELDLNLKLLHHYLDQLTVADILFDSQEGLWATTLEQGVFHCKNIHEYHYDNMDGLAGEIKFLKIINNKFFAGTINGKLLIIGPGGSRVIKLSKHDIQDIIPWQAGYLVGATNAVFSLSPGYTSAVAIPQIACYQLLAQEKNFLRVGPQTLSVFSAHYVLKYHLELPSKIRCLLPLGTDSMLVGCAKGLLLIKEKQFAIPPYLSQLTGCNVSDIKKDMHHNIWIGTKGDGLFILTPDRCLQKIKTPSGIITNIAFLKDSIVLLSTNTGLYAGRYPLSYPEWTDLYQGEVLNALPYHNKIFIGTKRGLVAYDTAALFNPPAFPVYLNAVRANGRSVSTGDIRIQSTERDIVFNFDLLAYNRKVAPLSYHLSGPLSSRGQVAGTELFLQNLPPGSYTLYVYGAKEKHLLTVPFYVRPAFWQTKIFLLFISAAVLGLLLAGAYWLSRRTRNAAYKKAAVARMLSEYKLTALKAQINPHFMSNSLAAIQQLMLSNEVDKASRYLALFSLLIRQVLQYSDKSLVSLREELKIIELNVSLEQLRFSDQFIFETKLAAGIDPQQLYIPPLITQPFIENAIWHGLLPLKGQRRPRLLVHVRREENQIILSVIDNGVGRTTGRKQSRFQNTAFSSRGLNLTQSRIENLNQLYPGRKSQMKITDLFDHGIPAGTQIDIILPYIPTITHGN